MRPRAVTATLAAATAVLALIGAAVEVARYGFGHDYLKGLGSLFNLSSERNIPTFYSMFLLMLACALLTLISVLERREHQPDTVRWGVLAAGFGYLAYDEAFAVHEKLTAATQAVIGTPAAGILYYSWVIPACLGLMLLSAYFLPFMRRLPVGVRGTMVAAGIVYVGAAVGLEMVEGVIASRQGDDNPLYQGFTVVEETLEMVGIVIFIHALLGWLSLRHPMLSVAVRDRPNTRAAVRQASTA